MIARWFKAAPIVLKQAMAAFLVRQLYGTMWRLMLVIALLTLGMLTCLVLLIGFFRWFPGQLSQAWDYWATVLPTAWLMPLVFWSIAGPLALRLLWAVSSRVAEATEGVPLPEQPEVRRLLASRLPVVRPIARFHAWERALIEAAFEPGNLSQARSARLEASLAPAAPASRSQRL